MFTKVPAFVAGNVAWNTRIRFVTHAPTKFPPVYTQADRQIYKDGYFKDCIVKSIVNTRAQYAIFTCSLTSAFFILICIKSACSEACWQTNSKSETIPIL